MSRKNPNGEFQRRKVQFRTAPDKKPKHFDLLVGPDAAERGIYSLEGDTFILCYSGRDNFDRPTEFKTKKGSVTQLLKFRRVDDARDPNEAAGTKPETVSAVGKWEYKIVPQLRWVPLPKEPGKPDGKLVQISEADLNELGDDGWELCGVMNKPQARANIVPWKVYLLFKRPKPPK